MKKLFRIKIEHECFLIADNEQQANENFWELRNSTSNETIDNFIDDITTTEEIEEAEELNNGE